MRTDGVKASERSQGSVTAGMATSRTPLLSGPELLSRTYSHPELDAHHDNSTTRIQHSSNENEIHDNVDVHPSSTVLHSQSDFSKSATTSFTDSAFRRDSCKCAESVWLCEPCGRSIQGADMMYVRGWDWRKRYSDYLGGRGSGIGEGAEGVHCGREKWCLDAKEVEHVIEWNDRSAEEGKNTAETEGLPVGMNGALVEDGGSGSSSIDNTIATTGASLSTSASTSSTHPLLLSPSSSMHARPRNGTSYHAQEVEGIGGVVRRTTSHRERVGAVVPEYGDERQKGLFMKAEREGQIRSWCAWCFRVVPSHGECEGK